MKKYYISYRYHDGETFGAGSSFFYEGEDIGDLLTDDGIREVQERIRKNNGFKSCVITNIIPLRG